MVDPLVMRAVFYLPFVAFALAALYVGYLAYQTSQERARVKAAPPASGEDPIRELSRLNAEVAESLGRARRTLEETRATLQRGIRG